MPKNLRKSEFKDPLYRQAYAESHLGSSIALQLLVLRRQRNMTKEELARAAGLPVRTITLYETDGYCHWDIQKLMRMAGALDVCLKISFETFGLLLREVKNLSAENLERPTFKQEGNPRWRHEPGPIGEMRRKLFPFLSLKNAPLDKLFDWCQGYDLPPVGDETLPWEWLLLAVENYPIRRQQLIFRTAEALRALPTVREAKRPNELGLNLYALAEKLGTRHVA